MAVVPVAATVVVLVVCVDVGVGLAGGVLVADVEGEGVLEALLDGSSVGRSVGSIEVDVEVDGSGAATESESDWAETPAQPLNARVAVSAAPTVAGKRRIGPP